MPPTSNLQDTLTRVLLEGGTLDALIGEVAGALAVGAAVTSTDGRVRASALSPEQLEALAAADLTDETGRIRVERASGDGAPVGRGRLVTLPVVASGADLARLVAVHPRSPDEDDLVSLRRAADLTALLMTREQAVGAVENKYRGDFLRDVFARRAGAEEYVVEHAGSFGWDLDRPMLVVTAEIEPPGEDEEPVGGEQRRRWQERFATGWGQVARDLAPGSASVDFSSEVITLLPAGPDGPDQHGLVQRAVTLVAGDKGGGRRPFTVGVSREIASVAALPTGYAQARRALEVGRRVRGPSSVTHFDQLGLHRLLALVPDPRELADYADDVLGELAVDTPEAEDLRTTLQILLDTNFNVAEAARLQFFHYNTMRYRLAKLERLLGPLATDPHLRLDVAVALRAWEIDRG